MTEIRLGATEEKTEITVMGHCNAGRINGFDLCCCAVSMLTFTLMETLSKLNLDSYHASYGGGWCYISFSNCSQMMSKAKTAIDTIMNGYEMLEKSYPANINIIKD